MNARKPKPCRWCAEGHKLIKDEHWIVKGLGRITIKTCTAVAKAAAR